VFLDLKNGGFPWKTEAKTAVLKKNENQTELKTDQKTENRDRPKKPQPTQH